MYFITPVNEPSIPAQQQRSPPTSSFPRRANREQKEKKAEEEKGEKDLLLTHGFYLNVVSDARPSFFSIVPRRPGIEFLRREREREKERDIFANIPGRVRASIRHLSRGGYPRFKGKVSGADDLSMPRLRTSRRKWITRSEASLSLSVSRHLASS